MKANFFLSSFLLTALVQAVSPWWWTLPIVTALVTLWSGGPVWRVVLQAAAATALVWLGYALMQYFGSDGILTKRLAELFHMPHLSLLFILTAVVGGLMGGLGALCGYRMHQHLMPRTSLPKQESVYVN